MKRPLKKTLVFEDVHVMLGAEKYLWYNNQMLSEADTKLVKDCYGIWYMVLLDVLSVKQSTPEFGRCRQLLQQILRIDVSDWMKTLDSMNDILLRSVNDYDNHRAEYISAAASIGCVKPLGVLVGLIKPIRIDWERYKNPDAFSRLRQLFVCINRLPLRDVSDLQSAAVDKWLAIEDQPEETDYSGPEADIIAQWFPKDTWPFKEAYPKHGSGRTSEDSNTSIGFKYKHMRFDQKTEYFFRALGFESEAEKALSNSVRRREEVSPPDLPDELAFVPKSWKINRSITFTNIGRMYAQQTVRDWIYETVDNPRHPLHKIWQPYSNERNRAYALKGSRDGRYVTIDFSSASDSVSNAMVRKFYRKSGLFMPLYLTRSSFVHYSASQQAYQPADANMLNGPTDFLRRYRMFAPMGSATCFAVLSITVAAIAIGTIRQFPHADQTCLVVGDDLIVAAEVADAVIRRFEELGFTVNRDKSFTNAWTWTKSPIRQHFFRESCGVEALDGFEITPFRIPRKFLGLPRKYSEDPQVVAQTMVMCNNAAGFRLLRKYLIWSLTRLKIKVLFDLDGTKGIRSANPTNGHLKKDYDNEIQEYYLNAWSLSAKAEKRHDPDGEVALFEWLRTANHSANRRKPLRSQKLRGERLRPLHPDDVVRLNITEEPFKVYADRGLVLCTENGTPL
jgi:hypothetical protein